MEDLLIEPERQRLRSRSKTARIRRRSGSEEVESLGINAVSTPWAVTRASNMGNAGAMTSAVSRASDSSSDRSDGEPEYQQQNSNARRKQVAENRALWESTLPEATENLVGHIDPNYSFIDYGDTPKREFRVKQRKKSDLFEFPKNPFRH